MSLSKLESAINKGQDWLKLAAAIDELVRECLLPLLHREGPYKALAYTGLPRDKAALFTLLSDASHQRVINGLIRKGILHSDQLLLLLPASKETDSSKLDLTLIVLLIRNFSGIKTLNGQWRDDCLDAADTTLASFVVKVLALRNQLFHWGSMTTMTTADSKQFWTDVVNVAKGLQYAGDISRFKTITLDPENVQAYKLLYQGLEHSCKQLRNEHDKLKSDHIKLSQQTGDYDKKLANIGIIERRIVDLENKLEILNEFTKMHNDNYARLFLESKEDVISIKLDFQTFGSRINNLEKRVENLESQEKNNNNGIEKKLDASPEVIQLIASLIGNDWKRLAENLQLKIPLITLHRNSEKNMMKCFAQRKNVKWHEVKNGLKNTDRKDIIHKICETFNMDDDNIHRREYKTTDLWYTIQSHASVEISDVNQQSNVKVLKDNDKISYLSGGDSRNTMTLENWDKRCNDYYHRYFSKQHKTMFPPAISRDSTADKMANIIIDSSNSQDGNFSLFTRYDVINHVRMHIGNTETYNKLLKDLIIASDEELKRSDNRMLLFNPESKLMLNIRLTEDTDINAIDKEESNGRSDLKLILFLFKRLIEGSGITLANVVLTPNISLDGTSMCCNNCLIVDQRILNSESGIFREWWHTNIISKLRGKDLTKNTDDVMKIISAVFGFMTTRQINVNDSTSFPKFRAVNTCDDDDDVHDDIVNQLFTYDQSRAINHPVLKKMVFGGFGAGKSIVGQHQLNELAKQEANTRNHTFYILWDDNSLMYLEMKEITKGIVQTTTNKRCYCFNRRDLVQHYLGLSKIPRLSELFQMIQRKCAEDTVHIIIEEFDQENLDNYEAERLDAMFKTEEWKPSHVLFLPQSMEKNRNIILCGEQGLMSVNTPYRLISSMSCLTLGDHMRSTISNYEFTKISAEIITSEVKNCIPHSTILNCTEEEKNDKVAERNEITGGNATADTSAKHQHIGNGIADNFEAKINVSNDRNAEIIKENEMPFQASVPLDELQISHVSFHGSTGRTETSYSCRTSNKVGHNIEGKMPHFIHHDDELFGISLSSLCIVIREKCFKSECNRLFICKSKDSFLLITNILKLLEEKYIDFHPLSRYAFVNEEGIIINELPRNYNLITDNKGARGLECPLVVVFIGNEDINEQQTFLETTSRCTSELFIIFPHQFKTNDIISMPPVLHQVMKRAIQEKKVKECAIKDFQLDDTDISFKQYHVSDKQYFLVNTESRKYKQLDSMKEHLTPIHVFGNMSPVSPFDSPQGLKCNIISSDHADNIECNLTWTDSPYDYIVRMKKHDSDNWEYISKPISTSSHVFDDLIKDEEYILSVATISSLGESIPAQLKWKHVDLLQLIVDNDLESLRRIINTYPLRINDENKFGHTLDHHAAMLNRSNILTYLLQVDDKNIDKCHQLNRTALQCASYNGSVECVKILLSHGADFTLKDEDGRTAYDNACEWDDADKSKTEVIKEMLKNYMER